MGHHVRWMIAHDVRRVLEIEAASFEPPAGTEEEVKKLIRPRNRIGMCVDEYLGGEPPRDVSGYMVYQLHEKRLELVRFAVAPDRRRRGVATSMVAKLFSKLSSHRRTVLFATVPERDLAAQLFLKACGLRVARVERGVRGEDDYYRFEYRLSMPVPEWYAAELGTVD